MVSKSTFIFLLFITLSNSFLCDLTNEFCVRSWNQLCPEEELNTVVLDGTLYSFRNFDVISFGNLQLASNGIVEGRVATRDNFNGGSNSVVGNGITANDISLPFSLVVGKNANWISGSLLPEDERAWVGGNFTSDSQSLSTKRTGGPCNQPSCLSTYFDNSRKFWNDSVDRVNGFETSVNFNVTSGVMSISCPNATSSTYVINIDGNAFNSINKYATPVNCRSDAIYAFNIRGTGDVVFQGEPFLAGLGSIFTIIGVGRTVILTSTVFGTIVNPRGSLDQTNGVLYGTAVFGNFVNIVHIGRPECFGPNSTIPTSTSTSTSASSSTGTGASTTSATGASTTSGTPSTTGSTTGSVPSTSPNCPLIDFEDDITSCDGMEFTLGGKSLSFVDYQVISFKNFYSEGGDTEGRLAVAGSVVLQGNGFSVGDKIVTVGSATERYADYSLIANKLNWTSDGNLFPDGKSSTIENAFVGNSDYTVPSYLKNRVVASCVNDSDCLSSIFIKAQACYTKLQNTLSSASSNVVVSVKRSQLIFTCNAKASRYYVTLTPAQLDSVTWYGLSNCQSDAQWIINIVGEGDVLIKGDSMPTTPENVVYNVIGSSRTIKISTGVRGSLLAPNNILHQESGVIRGKVIVGDATAVLQINKPNCPPLEGDNDNGTDEDSNSTPSNSDASIEIPNLVVMTIAVFCCYFLLL